ncbi:AbrB family transcriptional regulator [Chromohalobacter israelensis]|uniref:AbrB family transcriptional regulator n=1 Tax=Chromohalobacter israelensis TaxID=141390 RepID=UPI00215B4A30|nr:AbrB family transcriptional regulator [Chromohalobacter salexigens]
MAPSSSSSSLSSRLRRLGMWLALLLACVAASGLLTYWHMPAGGFIGPMLVGIAFGVGGSGLRLPRRCFKLGQGTIGVLIAHTMTMSVLMTILDGWLVMLLATAITLLLSLLVGIGLVRYGGLPGSTAAWGTTPGAAAAMVAMAEEREDTDPRIVAAMQYVRVVCVVLVGALVSHWLGAGDPAARSEGSGWPGDLAELFDLAITLAVVVGGVWLCDRRFPAGALLGPMVIGSVLHLGGWGSLTIPTPLLLLAYGCIGVYVGLRFDRAALTTVARSLGKMVIASMLLIGLCALSALLMVGLMDTQFITAYLATSPGGLDSMTIIAIDTHADVGLVVALQTLRLFTVVLVGPAMARFIARFARPMKSSASP